MAELIRKPIVRSMQPMRTPIKPKEKHKYIFPNLMAKMMKNVPMDVQLESSMMASVLILLGMILMGVYMMAFTEQTMAFKVLLIINLGAAFLFLSSSLVTTYQQYVSYQDVMEIQKTMMKSDSPFDLAINDLKMDRPKINRFNQFLFFGGLIIIIAAFFVPELLINNYGLMSQYEYYVLWGMVLLGVLMIFLALKKKKKKIVKPISIQPQMRAVSPTEVPPIQTNYLQQQPTQQVVRRPLSTEQRAQLIQRRAAQIRQEQQKPAQLQVERPSIQVQRPIERQIKEEIKQSNPPAKKSIFSGVKINFNSQKKISAKEAKALKEVEKALDERLYEINRLKSQQR